MNAYTRKTKVESYKLLNGETVHVGDLVWSTYTSQLPNGYALEGEVVDLVRGYVVIDQGSTHANGSPRYAHQLANHVEIVECVKPHR